MTVFALAAAAGSPGVTTTTLALAACWPSHREPLILEADPSGGDLVARLAALDGDITGLAETPSTVQLAARSRSGVSDRVLLEHLQRLPGPGEVRALVAAAGPYAASTAIGALTACGLADVLARLSAFDVLIDLGRLDPTSPAFALACRATLLVLIVRPTLEGVRHCRELHIGLRSARVRSSLLVVGDRPYAPIDVATAVEADLLGVVPDDTNGARALCGEARNARVLARTRLMRAAAELAHRLAPGDAIAGSGWATPSEQHSTHTTPAQVH